MDLVNVFFLILISGSAFIPSIIEILPVVVGLYAFSRIFYLYHISLLILLPYDQTFFLYDTTF